MNSGNLRGHAKPSDALLRRIGKLYGHESVKNVTATLDDVVAVDAFAALLTQAIEINTSKDGRVDMKDVAAFVVKKMRENQK